MLDAEVQAQEIPSLEPQGPSHAEPAGKSLAPQPAARDESDIPLPLRGDTVLGICEAIGQDFGFNPNYLRILLGAGLLWSATAMVGIYFGLGILVVVSRRLFPAPQRKIAVERIETLTPEPLGMAA